MILVKVLICLLDFSVCIYSKPLNLNFASLGIVFGMPTWVDLDIGPWVEYESHIVIRVHSTGIVHLEAHNFWEKSVSRKWVLEHLLYLDRV